MSVENLREQSKNPISEVYREMNEDIDADLKEAEVIINEGLDSSEIKRLTPELAKSLVEKYQGERLDLSGLTVLDKETARELAKTNCNYLYLNITRLDRETAAELARWKGHYLYLDRLTRLDRETAAELAKWEGDQLYLNGIRRLDKETAAALANFKGKGLFLNGLGRLDKVITRELVKYHGNDHNLDGSLSLKGLRILDEGIAAELVKFKGKRLELYGLRPEENGEVIGIDILLPIESKLCIRNNQVRNALNIAKMKNVIVEKINDFEKKIELTGDNKEDIRRARGKIGYNFGNKMLESWGQKTGVNFDLKNNKATLSGLEIKLSIEGGLRLANFKNWVKNKYTEGEKVSFESDFISNRNFDKTLVVDGTSLITKGKFYKNLGINEGNDEVVEQIVEWLNKR